MSGLLVTSIVVWICSLLEYGFGIAVLSSFVSTVMFCLRKVGIFVNPRLMIIIESLALFLSIVFKIVFGHLSWVSIIGYILLRAIFYGIVLWDTTQYVYVKEVHRKGE